MTLFRCGPGSRREKKKIEAKKLAKMKAEARREDIGFVISYISNEAMAMACNALEAKKKKKQLGWAFNMKPVISAWLILSQPEMQLALAGWPGRVSAWLTGQQWLAQKMQWLNAMTENGCVAS